MSAKATYETTFIVNATLEDNSIEQIINGVSQFITTNGGAIISVDKWGRKRLAYSIDKKSNGYYVHVVFTASGTLTPQLERYYFLEDNIIRFLTIKLTKKALEYRNTKELKPFELQDEKETVAVEETETESGVESAE